jgi:hypothetical protein
MERLLRERYAGIAVAQQRVGGHGIAALAPVPPAAAAAAMGGDDAGEDERKDGGGGAAAAAAAAPAAAPFVEEPDTGAKFAGFYLSYSSTKLAARGIWAAMGILRGSERQLAILEGAGAAGVAAGVALVRTEFHGPAADHDDRRRFRDIGGLALARFCAKGEALQAGLTTAHVLALRLYTTNSYWQINTPFRRGCAAALPHPFAATAFYMYDGIKRLRKVLADAPGAGEPRAFWRGMSGARVTQEFMEQFTSKGGTEMAPMSTSDDEAVARRFAKWDDAACTDAVLIKVEAADHTCCGADLAWLSMYAGEREVLFPPLTYLEYVSHEQLRPGRTVITARPSFS